MDNIPDPPKFSIAVADDENTGKCYAWLLVTTPYTVHQFWLCNADTFRNTAKEFNDNILKAGQEMNKRKSGIVTVKGLPDDLVRPKEGRS